MPNLRSLSFWGSVVVVFLIVVSYPAALGFAHPTRFSEWLRNDLAFSVFGLWILPLLFGLVASVVLPSVHRALPGRDRQVFVGLTALLVGCGIVVAVADLERTMEINGVKSIPALAEPVMFATSEAFDLDGTSRSVLRPSLAALLEAPTDAARVAWNTQRTQFLTAYTTAFPGFRGFSDFWRRGNVVAKVKFAINILAASTAALLFAGLLAAVWIAQKRPQTRLNRDGFIVACSLAVLWFPLRLYTEWYIRYYSLSDLEGYSAFWLLAVVATVSLIAVVAVLKPRKMSVVIPAIGAIGSGIATVVGCVRPDVLLTVTAIVEGFTLPMFAVLVIVVASFLAVFAASVAEQPPVTGS
jgi:hypothetical protein